MRREQPHGCALLWPPLLRTPTPTPHCWLRSLVPWTRVACLRTARYAASRASSRRRRGKRTPVV